jgi:hypothetical protein
MTTTASKSTPSAKKPASKQTPKPAAKAVAKKATPAAVPSMKFQYTQALHARADAVLNSIDSQPDQRGHGDALADLVAELVDAGMDHYFLRGLKMADLGFITEQSARLGMSGAVKVINSVSRKFIVRMNGAQLQAVASHIRSLT